jgi:hypothetical protein
MGSNNETKGKTQVKQGSQDSEPEDRSGGMEPSSEHCSECGNDQISAGRTDRQGRNLPKSDSRNREEVLGKILSQLRKIEKSHLAYVEAHEGRLEARLKESRKHKEQIVVEIQQLEEEINALLHDEDEE